MRLDKYLKVSRIIKRRTVASEAASLGRIQINGKVAKPSEGPRMRMPGLTALSGRTEIASPASTAAPTAVEFQLA